MKKEKLVMGPDGGLTPGQTGRLTINRKITLILTEGFQSCHTVKYGHESSGTQNQASLWQSVSEFLVEWLVATT
jgi:hypothetical protein